MYAAGPVGSAPLCAVAAARLPREALPPLPPRFVPTPCVCAPQIAGKIRPVIEAYTLKSPCILEIPSKAHHYVTRDTHSRPEASADWPPARPASARSSSGRPPAPASLGQLRSASVSLGQPRPASANRCSAWPALPDTSLNPNHTGAPVRLGAGRHPQAHEAPAGHPRVRRSGLAVVWVGGRWGRSQVAGLWRKRVLPVTALLRRGGVLCASLPSHPCIYLFPGTCVSTVLLYSCSPPRPPVTRS